MGSKSVGTGHLYARGRKVEGKAEYALRRRLVLEMCFVDRDVERSYMKSRIPQRLMRLRRALFFTFFVSAVFHIYGIVMHGWFNSGARYFLLVNNMVTYALMGIVFFCCKCFPEWAFLRTGFYDFGVLIIGLHFTLYTILDGDKLTTVTGLGRGESVEGSAQWVVPEMVSCLYMLMSELILGLHFGLRPIMVFIYSVLFAPGYYYSLCVWVPTPMFGYSSKVVLYIGCQLVVVGIIAYAGVHVIDQESRGSFALRRRAEKAERRWQRQCMVTESLMDAVLDGSLRLDEDLCVQGENPRLEMLLRLQPGTSKKMALASFLGTEDQVRLQTHVRQILDQAAESQREMEMEMESQSGEPEGDHDNRNRARVQMARALPLTLHSPKSHISTLTPQSFGHSLAMSDGRTYSTLISQDVEAFFVPTSLCDQECASGSDKTHGRSQIERGLGGSNVMNFLVGFRTLGEAIHGDGHEVEVEVEAATPDGDTHTDTPVCSDTNAHANQNVNANSRSSRLRTDDVVMQMRPSHSRSSASTASSASAMTRKRPPLSRARSSAGTPSSASSNLFRDRDDQSNSSRLPPSNANAQALHDSQRNSQWAWAEPTPQETIVTLVREIAGRVASDVVVPQGLLTGLRCHGEGGCRGHLAVIRIAKMCTAQQVLAKFDCNKFPVLLDPWQCTVCKALNDGDVDEFCYSCSGDRYRPASPNVAVSMPAYPSSCVDVAMGTHRCSL